MGKLFPSLPFQLKFPCVPGSNSDQLNRTGAGNRARLSQIRDGAEALHRTNPCDPACARLRLTAVCG
jgi:hypothetical protein